MSLCSYLFLFTPSRIIDLRPFNLFPSLTSRGTGPSKRDSHNPFSLLAHHVSINHFPVLPMGINLVKIRARQCTGSCCISTHLWPCREAQSRCSRPCSARLRGLFHYRLGVSRIC